jgi:hypothetical protein
MTTRVWKMEDGEWTARQRLECVRFSAAFFGPRGGPPAPLASVRESAGQPAHSKPWRLRLAFFGALPFAFCLVAAAQPYPIDWSTLDGGGGTSTGGAYSVSGTIGQPDAGMMSGGNFSLSGGFWPGIIVSSTGEAPTLFIQQAGDSVILSWSPATAGFELEATTALGGDVWAAAPAGNPVTLPITGPAQFYRLKKL